MVQVRGSREDNPTILKGELHSCHGMIIFVAVILFVILSTNTIHFIALNANPTFKFKCLLRPHFSTKRFERRKNGHHKIPQFKELQLYLIDCISF
ncbi:hypothetical protein ACJIZ3_003632 [Penstemon smallii]|uniref:Transmembrane protein n=1 Tax=Penstemon smallii TaxID=265156 RepID=A0ABD3U9S6_9LAMI